MKKILLSALFLVTSLLCFAQPTYDFETWEGTGANIAPKGWVSENAAVAPPLLNNPQSVFQETNTADVHGGTYAMKVLSVKMTTNPAVGKIPDPVGLAAIGVASVSPPTLKFGFPNTNRPESISFWYKYTPLSTGDTAVFFTVLTKWNTGTNKRDTIASGLWASSIATTAYAQQTTTLIYKSADTPDSMALIFSSTNLLNSNFTLCMNCGKAGSTLWVDDITFTLPTNINNIKASNEGVILYPNPAADVAYISVNTNNAYAVNLFDIAGKQVKSVIMQEAQGINKKAATLNTAGMSAGLYSYTITDKNGSTLRAGKLNVAK